MMPRPVYTVQPLLLLIQISNLILYLKFQNSLYLFSIQNITTAMEFDSLHIPEFYIATNPAATLGVSVSVYKLDSEILDVNLAKIFSARCVFSISKESNECVKF